MDVSVLTVCLLSAWLFCLGQVDSLNCWHCIADNCHLNPQDNYKAYKSQCQPGQQCQKVYFEMQSDVTSTKYVSTVRSCAEHCQDQDDFLNCSNWKATTRGCIKKTCCRDDDLCNTGRALHGTWGPVLTRVGVVLLASVVYSAVCVLVS